MKKIIVLTIVLIVNVFAVDEFTIAKSKDNAVCTQVLNLLNDDLKNHRPINLNKHKEFNWIQWKPLQEKFQNSLYVAHFDINNDERNESVFITKLQYHYYDTESIYFMSEQNGSFFEIEYDDTKRRDGQMVENSLGIIKGYSGVNSFYKYKENKCNKNIEKVEYVELLGKNVSRIYLAQHFPMKLNGATYIAVFGFLESLKERKDIAATNRDAVNDGNVMMLIKIDKNNHRENVCYFQRDNYRLDKWKK